MASTRCPAYVLSCEERAQERRKQKGFDAPAPQPAFEVRSKNGRREPLDEEQLQSQIAMACEGLDGVSAVYIEVGVGRAGGSDSGERKLLRNPFYGYVQKHACFWLIHY